MQITQKMEILDMKRNNIGKSRVTILSIKTTSQNNLII